MSHRYTQERLAAYCDSELTAPEADRVAAHLESCSACRVDLAEIRLAVSLAGSLPRAEAPARLWENIEERLDSRPAQPPTLGLRWLALGVAGAGVLAAVVVFLANRPAHSGRQFLATLPPRPSWEVARVAGSPRVGLAALAGVARLPQGQWLETDSSSRARLKVADIGQLVVEPNSRLRMEATGPNQHRVQLARGSVRARVVAPPRLFVVDTPSASAVDLGCAYRLSVEADGATLLRVTWGYVSLERQGREALVPAGAACRTIPGLGPTTPCYEDAPAALKSALDRFDRANDQGALSTVLRTARPRDGMTLLQLLSRTTGAERLRVYARLAQLDPPPTAAGVSRERALALDREALDVWRLDMAGRDTTPIPPEGAMDGTKTTEEKR